MTPFKIRQRLKKARKRILRGERLEVETIYLDLVLPDGSEHRVTTEPDYTLTMASQLLDTPIHAACPDGTCGECRVEIHAYPEGLKPATDAEREILGDDLDKGIRLACHARLVESGVKVKVNSVWRMEDSLGE